MTINQSKISLDTIQSDIVYKALYLLAKENKLELPQDIEGVCAQVAESNPYDTDLIHIVEVLEHMTPFIKSNEAYDILFTSLLEVKDYLDSKTGGQFNDGINGYYLTYYNNLAHFLEECEGLMDDEIKAQSQVEQFESITGEKLTFADDIPFLTFDSPHFEGYNILTRIDEYAVNKYLDDIKFYYKK